MIIQHTPAVCTTCTTEQHDCNMAEKSTKADCLLSILISQNMKLHWNVLEDFYILLWYETVSLTHEPHFYYSVLFSDTLSQDLN